MERIYRLLLEYWFAFYRIVTFAGLNWLLKRYVRQAGNAPPGSPVSGRILYVAASALPYHTTGYTTRTHAIIRALNQTGLDVRAMTRPGYPWDRQDRTGNPEGEATCVDGVEYAHADRPTNFRPLLQFVFEGARVIARKAREDRVALIHAASNHVNALPALYAAKKLGLPFHYEMRGLWEFSRASRFPGFDQTEAFRLGLELEGFVASQAEHVFVISEQLARYARENWGVPEARISLLPNCVDPQHFVASPLPDGLGNTIVYAGALIGYEGLDTLLEASALLVERGVPLKVSIVGHGEAKAGLMELAGRLKLDGVVDFPGKLKPEEARTRVSQASLVCIPRKPYKVCEMIPPIKMVEAMAMGKPVIVPDLPVFRDELGEDPAGWFFRAGDAVSLANTIAAALSDTSALALMSQRAREYAVSRRNWQMYVRGVAESVGKLERVGN